MQHVRFEVRNRKPPHPLMGWLDLSNAAVMLVLANEHVTLPLCPDEQTAKRMRAEKYYSLFLYPTLQRIDIRLTEFEYTTNISVDPWFLQLSYSVILTDDTALLERLPGYVHNLSYTELRGEQTSRADLAVRNLPVEASRCTKTQGCWLPAGHDGHCD